MHKFRYINTKFWTDGFIINLDPLEKYLFMYCLTNPHTTAGGVYECPLKVMANETGLDKDILEKMLATRFEGKIFYIDGWIYIRNFIKHQKPNENMKKGALNAMKETPLSVRKKILEINKQYPISEDEDLNEEELKKEEEMFKSSNEILEKQIDDIFEFYKKKINSNTKITSKSRDKVRTRLKEKSTEPEKVSRFDELKLAIENFSKNDWRMKHNASMGVQWFFKSEDQIVTWLMLEASKAQSFYKIK